MNNRDRYEEMVVKRFVNGKEKQLESERIWEEAGYYVPWITAGSIFGAIIGAALAFYAIYYWVIAPFIKGWNSV